MTFAKIKPWKCQACLSPEPIPPGASLCDACCTSSAAGSAMDIAALYGEAARSEQAWRNRAELLREALQSVLEHSMAERRSERREMILPLPVPLPVPVPRKVKRGAKVKSSTVEAVLRDHNRHRSSPVRELPRIWSMPTLSGARGRRGHKPSLDGLDGNPDGYDPD